MSNKLREDYIFLPIDTSSVWKRGENATITAARPSAEEVCKPEDSASQRTKAISVKDRRSTSHSKHPHSVEGTTRDTRDATSSDIDNLAAELSGILTSTSAIAKPFAALERALSHHREHISGSSVHTYNMLLAYAARIGNYHGMRKILRDMQKGNVQWNEETRMIVTKATMRGPGGGAVRGEKQGIRSRLANDQPCRA
jgi:pentatricopeptide repeat protein